ncbi:hypothetical protein [Mucisphaera sp.]|uniref:hypothetical protein n=1 Tax=Mucisphaera sp. TaxID=2913024 RepID=UPI003D0BE4D4
MIPDDAQPKPSRNEVKPRTLGPLDAAALDALMEARAQGVAPGPMPPSTRERSERISQLLDTLATDHPNNDPPLPDELRARTLQAVRDARQRARFTQQVDELSRPAGAPSGFGVSWRQVIAAGLVLLVGGSLLMPVLEENRAAANRALCQDNLAAAGIAFNAYASDHNGLLPRNPLAATAGNSANLFTMITNGYLQPAQLACPENEHFDRASQANASATNWESPELVSYSYQHQRSPQPTRIDTYPTLAVLADRNPLFRPTPTGFRFDASIPPKTSSTIHHQPGQNVLQADGTVSWWNTPIYTAGDTPDNIWTVQGVTNHTGQETPSHEHDSFLLP